MDIARVVGATEKMNGYCTGNGYMVTWALGHLVQLALPGTYGYTKTTAADLPMLPDPFRLVSRLIRTDRGTVTDLAASRQLKIIEGVFSRCESIIVATDAGREGELIFRWIYELSGMHQAVHASVDFIAYRRGYPGRYGQSQERQRL